jgi:hypothetical protein
MNLAMNQTLSRTIITSGTVFLATLALYVFGGSVINDFAFTFLVGILTGTYSTMYIASAIVLWWHKGQRPVDRSGAGRAPRKSATACRGRIPRRAPDGRPPDARRHHRWHWAAFVAAVVVLLALDLGVFHRAREVRLSEALAGPGSGCCWP